MPTGETPAQQDPFYEMLGYAGANFLHDLAMECGDFNMLVDACRKALTQDHYMQGMLLDAGKAVAQQGDFWNIEAVSKAFRDGAVLGLYLTKVYGNDALQQEMQLAMFRHDTDIEDVALRNEEYAARVEKYANTGYMNESEPYHGLLDTLVAVPEHPHPIVVKQGFGFMMQLAADCYQIVEIAKDVDRLDADPNALDDELAKFLREA